MAEEKVLINSSDLEIEGFLENLQGNKAVLVTHPHPLYGGNMHNNVVIALVKAYRKNGYSTLRINFRGVDGSQGVHDNGIGEQEDIRASLAYLSDLGKDEIDLVGYSFGAWVTALGLISFDQADRIIMISPPVSFLDFSLLSYTPKIKLVITGSHDEFASSEKIEDMLLSWNPEAVFRIIPGADHFFWGKDEEIMAKISDFLEK